MQGFGLRDIKASASKKPPLAVIKEDILSGENFQKYAEFISKTFIDKYKDEDDFGNPNRDMPNIEAGEKIVEMLSNFNKIKIFSDRLAQQMYQATDEYNDHIEQTKELLSQVRKYSGTLIQYQSHFKGLTVEGGENAAFYKQLAENFGEFSDSLNLVGNALSDQLRDIIKAKKEQRSELIKRLALNKSLIIADNKTDYTILNAAKEISKLKKVIDAVPEKAKKLTGKMVMDKTNEIKLERPKMH